MQIDSVFTNFIAYKELGVSNREALIDFCKERVKDNDGIFVDPDDTTFAAAAAGADWFSVPGMGLSIVDQPGKNTWPISTASFIIMYKEPKDKKSSQEAIKFFDWAFRNGAKMSEELDYVHLPLNLQNQIRQIIWSKIKH